MADATGEIYFPDGTKLSAIIANLNVFATNPSTSKGEGEVIYNSTDNKVYVNTGTTTTPTWVEIGTGSGGVTDHGALTGLSDDDHSQYVLANGFRSMTGDLYIRKAGPNLILYPTSGESRVLMKNSSNVDKGSVYIDVDDMVVLCEDGHLYISTAVTSGGKVYLETKGATRLTIDDALITSAVDLKLDGKALQFAGSNKIERNSSTGDMEFSVAAGDSFVFKTV